MSAHAPFIMPDGGMKLSHYLREKDTASEVGAPPRRGKSTRRGKVRHVMALRAVLKHELSRDEHPLSHIHTHARTYKLDTVGC